MTGLEPNTEEQDDGSGEAPDYVNREDGISAWINTDTNGNKYITVDLPLNLGRVNLFPNKSKHEEE